MTGKVGRVVHLPEDHLQSSEAQVRAELAALNRAVHLFGWDDHIATHLSARVPGKPDHMLLAPLGAMFQEVTASSLVKTTLDGHPVDGDTRRVNRGGVVIHGGIYAGRPDVHWILHLHTISDVAVSAQRDGLLALSQYAMALSGKIGYHDYEGIALDDDERARLLQDIGDRPIALLRHHGSLVCGESVETAFFYTHTLQRACEIQIAALAGGRDHVQLCEPSVADLTAAQLETGAVFFNLFWAAALRRVDAAMPGYDA